jgi:SNF2 family DNA or RNA helicase
LQRPLQAVARIFRRGQLRETHVYRLMYAGTVEEKLYSQSVRKERLFRQVMDPKAGGATRYDAQLTVS